MCHSRCKGWWWFARHRGHHLRHGKQNTFFFFFLSCSAGSETDLICQCVYYSEHGTWERRDKKKNKGLMPTRHDVLQRRGIRSLAAPCFLFSTSQLTQDAQSEGVRLIYGRYARCERQAKQAKQATLALHSLMLRHAIHHESLLMHPSLLHHHHGRTTEYSALHVKTSVISSRNHPLDEFNRPQSNPHNQGRRPWSSRSSSERGQVRRRLLMQCNTLVRLHVFMHASIGRFIDLHIMGAATHPNPSLLKKINSVVESWMLFRHGLHRVCLIGRGFFASPFFDY